MTTGAASSITATTATVGGVVIANGAASAGGLSMGRRRRMARPGRARRQALGSRAKRSRCRSRDSTPATTYHFRVAASHAYGAGSGTDATFTTAAESPPRVMAGGTGGGGVPAGGGGVPAGGGDAPAVVPEPKKFKPAALPPLAKGCVSVRDFAIRLKRGVKARSVTVTVDGKRAKVSRRRGIRARINLRGKVKKIVVVKIVVTAANGKKTHDGASLPDLLEEEGREQPGQAVGRASGCAAPTGAQALSCALAVGSGGLYLRTGGDLCRRSSAGRALHS